MLDPFFSLALSMYNNKGVYALLLGSGVSRSAGIPTGWEIVLDLIRLYAQSNCHENCGDNPEQWYREKFNEDPDYSNLLEQVGYTATERQQFLKRHFGPPTTEDDQEQGLHTPTIAHKAIARLMKMGYIRVVVTTNFDRLLEDALIAESVAPQVIFTHNQIDGMLPLVHAIETPTIVKVHGDYLDSRIKNTQQELAHYHDNINSLLDRIFDEFGLLVCGWSATWDTALRDALSRLKNRRYSVYWAQYGNSPLSDEASTLLHQRGGQVINITGADDFFANLESKITSIAEYETPHPMSTAMAVAEVKRYIETGKKIRVADLVRTETERFVEQFIPLCQTRLEKADYLAKVDSHIETLLHMMATGCYWDVDKNTSPWLSAIDRLVNLPSEHSIRFDPDHCYPAYLLFYAAGITSVASGKYHTLAGLLTSIRVRSYDGERQLVMELPKIYTDSGYFNSVYKTRESTSNYMFEKFQTILRNLLPGKVQFERDFDRFEYIISMVHTDIDLSESGHSYSTPYGLFVYRSPRGGPPPISKVINEEIRLCKTDKWPPVQAGLFDGDNNRVLQANEKIAESLTPHRNIVM